MAQPIKDFVQAKEWITIALSFRRIQGCFVDFAELDAFG